MQRVPRFATACAVLTSFVLACSDDTVSPTDLQPVLASISPDSGNVGTAVELRGEQFAKGALVVFGSIPSPRVSYVSTTRIRAYAPDGLVLGGSYAVKVRNASSEFADASRPYRAVAPELMVVNGVSRPSGTPGSTVVLEGRSFGDMVGKGTVYFTGASGAVEAPVTIAANWSNEFIITEVPADAVTGPVWVDTPLGATDGIEFRILEAATFSPSQINWTQTASLPSPSQGHGAHFLSIEAGGNVDNVVFVTGGADGAPTARADILVGEIDAVGHIVSWTPATPLSEARAFHATETATPWNALIDTTVAGYLYEIGGINATGDVQSTVLFTAVASDRSLAGWAPTTALPVALHSAGAVILRSWLYVVGGATTGNAPRSTAYRARILEDGQLGPWQSLPSLPSARAYAPLVQWAGHLYVLGGDGAASAPGSNNVPNTTIKSILTQTIDLRTGGFKNSAWTAASSQLIKSVSKHSVIVAGGWLLASGGLYNGASSSATEHQYAAIDVDGSITSFNGATGSQTIANAGGVPFYNHAAITYVDNAGVAHVIIIGGGNVTNAATPTANCYFY